jgi:hypothetical protein
MISTVGFSACLGTLLLLNQRSVSGAAQATKTSALKTTIKGSFAEHTTAAVVAITTPVKLCSGVLAPNWRDTITVPDGWKAGTCQGFATSIGTSAYQLGCANPNSFSWGNMNGGTPPDNQCGW